MNPAPDESGKYGGLTVALPGYGRVQLTRVLAYGAETALYHTDHPGVVVKMFDLSCGKVDEISYGPYMSFRSELASFEEILTLPELRGLVPAYYGAQIDYGNPYACIAMEYLQGQDLRSWSGELAATGYARLVLDEFRRAVHQVLAILSQFHRHGVVVVDFKPENAVRLLDSTVRLVDLGALFTPRHQRDLQAFVYAATPDHAEVLIDASNLQAGVPPSEASDVFSAGVALFEMATGGSRLAIDPQTADEVLADAAIYLFRDSQIRDLWRAFPHLKNSLPMVQTQLRERRILFSELWHLLKAYVGSRVEGWDTLGPEQQAQTLLSIGTTFIQEQLPPPLAWLAAPIARATALRSHRLARIGDLVALLGDPIPDQVRDDLERHNCLLQCLRGLELPTDFASQLNTWEVRLDPESGHWTIAASVASRQLADTAEYVFLRQVRSDEDGHSYWHAVDESGADELAGGKANLCRIQGDQTAWLG